MNPDLHKETASSSVMRSDSAPTARGFLWLGLMLAVAVWFLESTLHAFLFDHRPFMEGLFPVDAYELTSRIIISCIIVGLGLYADRTIRRQRKKLVATRQWEQRYQNIINHNLDGILTIDRQEVVNFMNPAAEHILGAKGKTLVGNSLGVPLSNDQGAHIEIIHGKNDLRTLELRKADIPDEGEDSRIVWVRDISKRIATEQELVQKNRELEISNQAKSQFLSSMSHELRTPLNAILGFAQMLEHNPKEPLTETQQKNVNYVLRGGNHLLELIKQVLELSKIEAGQISLNVDHTPARDVIDHSLNFIQARSDRDGIKIIDRIGRDDLPLLWTDSTRLTQVLLNLLSNAVKYNRENGTVTLTCQEMPDRMLRISVADTGRGIPVDKQDDLFKPFERLGLEAGTIEGTGIGLTITQQIIEVLGGHIGFESEVDKGSTFWIDVPMSEKQGLDATNVKIATSTGRVIKELDETGSQYSALYVEDNPDNIQLMEMIIGRIGNTKLLIAYNVELGLDLAKSEHPDLILMDINLPGMNGIEALEQLQKTLGTKDIPVIAITADTMTKDVEAGMKAGFKAYITKPINVQETLQVINDALTSG